MSECSFKFNIGAGAAEVLKKINLQIEHEGGVFKGNENEGSFSLPTPVGVVEGSYTVSDNDLKIDITKKPAFLPCSMLETELKKRF